MAFDAFVIPPSALPPLDMSVSQHPLTEMDVLHAPILKPPAVAELLRSIFPRLRIVKTAWDKNTLLRNRTVDARDFRDRWREVMSSLQAQS